MGLSMSNPRAAGAAHLYAAAWRWHFYAGLLVLPFLVLLAVTGALYLFKGEIEAVVHRDIKQVAASDIPMLPPSQWIARAEVVQPGTVLKVLPPATPTSSAEIVVRGADGKRISVYLNPHDGSVLGTLPERGTAMWIVRRVHSLAEFGPIANGAIEIAGGWTLLLVGTGFVLWWPRGGAGGLRVRGRPRTRLFWRDVHAVTGVFAGLFIVVMAGTGMAWSVFWGDQVNAWANQSNHGYPQGVYVNVPMSQQRLAEVNGPTAWSLEQARVPQSMPAATRPIGVDRAVDLVEARGVPAGYTLSLPRGPAGVYSATVYPSDLTRQRVLHLDQYSGMALLDMSYGDYGTAARAMEWGINFHMGQEWGWFNKAVLLLLCLVVVVMAVSAIAMWWKRRPQGGLGVPPLPADRRALYGLLALMALGGLVFPLTGASLLLMAVLDFAATRGWRRLVPA